MGHAMFANILWCTKIGPKTNEFGAFFDTFASYIDVGIVSGSGAPKGVTISLCI
jgi:hypothetical protein